MVTKGAFSPSKQRFWIASVATLSFFAGLNLFGLRGVWLLLGLSLISLFLFLSKRLGRSLLFLFPLLFFASLTVTFSMYENNGLMPILLYFVLPVLGFLVGFSFPAHKKTFAVIVLSLSLGYALSAFLNLFFSISNGAAFNHDGLSFYRDIWGKASPYRTFFSIDLIPSLAVCVFCFFSYKGRAKALVWIVAFLVAALLLVVSGFVGNRSIYVVFFFLLLLNLFFSLFRVQTKTRFGLTLTFLLFLPLLAGSFFSGVLSKIPGIEELIEKAPGLARFIRPDLSTIARTQQYEAFWAHFLEFPIGGLSSSGLIREHYGETDVTVQIHNTYLQFYSIGGFPVFLSFLSVLVLIFYYAVCAFKTKKTDAHPTLIMNVFLALAILFFFEPIITSEPFLFTMWLLLAGFLCRIGKMAKTQNEKTFGLADFGAAKTSTVELGIKLGSAILLIAVSTSLGAISDNAAVFSLAALLLLTLVFALVDKSEYSALSIAKTVICLLVSCGFTIALNIYLPTNTWMYALAKSALSIAVFVFLRIIVVSRSEEKDGYYRLRNFFTKLAREIDGSPEENLVSQDLQMNNQGE